MDGTNGNKWWNVGGFVKNRLVGGLITEDKNLGTVLDIFDGLVAHCVQSSFNSGRSISKAVSGRNSGLNETSVGFFGKSGNLVHLYTVQNRRFKVDQTSTVLRNFVDTFLSSQSHCQGHHNTLTEWVNRRVGNLGKTLLEVIVKWVGFLTQSSNWGIISHRVGCLLGGSSHILDLHTNILKTPSESGLCKSCGVVIIKTVIISFSLGDFLAMLLHPFSVWVARSDFTLDANVVLEFSSFKVDVDHLARSQTSLLNNIGFLKIGNDTSLTHHVNTSVLGDGITSGTKTITIQRGTNRFTVRENKKGWTIPGLKQTSVEFVEVSDLGVFVQIWVLHVSSRDHSHQCAWGTVTRLGHQLEDRIQVGRIGSAKINDRLKEVWDVLGVAHSDNVLGGVIVDQVRVNVTLQRLGAFTGLHPVDVTEESVDLSVVSKHSHGLGKRPAGVGVGGETSVVDGELGCVIRIGQILVEGGQNCRLDHTLVDDGSGTQGSNIGFAVIPDKSSIFKLDGETAADKIQSTFKTIAAFVIVIKTFRGLDEELPDAGHGFSGQRTKDIRVNRDLTPSDESELVSSAHFFDLGLNGITLFVVHRKEDHTDTRLGAVV
mmetsp:Transcript_27317/g.66293  ORF Transcript_27317/g.66293 Transcript_27317/m.66293 type:complete len:600 (+) Transcript_27317:2920-4719(+)